MVSSTGTFVSCKDYDDDIDNINKELTDIKSKISDLEAKVSTGGAYVTKIESVAGGLKVSVSDGTSYNLTIAGDGVGSTVVIDKTTGEISIDGTTTGFFATTRTTPEGESAAPYVKDGFWYFYDDATKTFVKSEYKVSGNAWAVQKGDSVVLHIPNEAGVMQEITLPTSSSALTALAIPAGQNSLVRGANIGWGKAAADITWAGKKGNVKAGDLLIGTLPTAILDVTPASYDLSAQELTLVDVDGKTAPVSVVVTAENSNGTVGRAASTSGMWVLSITPNAEVTADNITTAFTKKVNGTDKNLQYALAVNGTVMTGYTLVIDTQTEVEQKLNKALDKAEISLAESSLAPGEATTLEIASSISSKVYDSYIKFEGAAETTAKKYNVTVDGMTVTVPSSAVDMKTIMATVYVLDVTGAEVKKDVQLTVAQSTPAEDETVAAVGMKVMYPGQSFTVDLGATFSNLDAIQASALTQGSAVLSSESKNFFALTAFNKLGVNATIKYYNAADKEVALTGDVRSITKAVVTLGDQTTNKTFYSGAASIDDIFGTFNLKLALLDSGKNQIKEITIPVTVSKPSFDDYYTKNANAGWDGDVLPVTIGNGVTYTANNSSLTLAASNAPAVTLTANIFTINKVSNNPVTTVQVVPVAAEDSKIVYPAKYEFGYTGCDADATKYEIGKSTAKTYADMCNNLSASGMNMVEDGVLKVKSVSAKATVAPITVTLESGATDVEVSKTFTIKLKNAFEGAQFVYYKNNVAQSTADVANDVIAALSTTQDADGNNIKNGLALKYGDNEIAVNSDAIKYTKTLGTFAFADNAVVGNAKSIVTPELTLTEGSYGDVVASGNGLMADGVKITGLTGTQGGTLTATFKDGLGMKTIIELPYKNAQ